jgi:UDP-N-acetylglucosamine:LPS N-acetylglucosamine transferase
MMDGSRGWPAKICLVTSGGGHLSHLLALKEWTSTRDVTWVAPRNPDCVERLKGQTVYWSYEPTVRNVVNLVRNAFLAIKVLRSEAPDVVISAGAGVAVPFAYVARCVGVPFVFIEVVDRVASKTLTGRLVEPVASLILVQWEQQRRLYRNAQLLGRLL